MLTSNTIGIAVSGTLSQIGLSTIASNLKSASTKRDELWKNNTRLTAESNHLRKSNDRLSKSNDKLSKRNENLKDAIKTNRKNIAQRSTKRITKKIAKASVAMIPIAGVTVVAASTIDDINDICKDIDDAIALEKDHTGTVDPKIEEVTNCYGEAKNQIVTSVQETSEQALKDISHSFSVSYDKIKKQADEISKPIRDFGEIYKENAKAQYQETIGYWSDAIERQVEKRQQNKIPQHPPTLLTRTGQYWGGKLFDFANQK